MKLPLAIRNVLTSGLTAYFRYVLMGVAFFVLLIGYLVLLKPQIENVQQQGVGQLQAIEKRVQERTDYLHRLQDMVQQYHDVVGQQNFNVVDILPAQPEIGKLFLTIEQLLNGAGLSLNSIAVTKGQALGTATSAGSTASTKSPAGSAAKTTSSTATIQVLNVNLTIGGKIDYAKYKELLDDFERSVRIFDLPSITFNPASQSAPTQAGSTEATSTTLSLEVKTYYLEQQPVK